ncbi:hypothetical protein PAAG_02714 [Paracoccidioides lutzii Pb01]|uniref:Uncharacterized protein n=1 Tax=Paracoccidioides lutzii (strain ATCC MYA-826 / Pb01) TaxID=502779 RepID=C1GW19_PARBA|nr:hypothetical protein PAAG_02714 [Paracoccidioides lutzii Pb01]EEH40738.2 hypothetical protein PAAG_02714 [Paracoccidioides lutzii Pb01]
MAGKAEDRLIGSVEQPPASCHGSNFRSVGNLSITNDNTSIGVLMDVPQSERLGKCNTKFLMKEALSSIRRHSRVLAHALFVQASRTYENWQVAKRNVAHPELTRDAFAIKSHIHTAMRQDRIQFDIKALGTNVGAKHRSRRQNWRLMPVIGLSNTVCVGLDLPSLGRPVVGSGLVRRVGSVFGSTRRRGDQSGLCENGTRGWLPVGNGEDASEVEVAYTPLECGAFRDRIYGSFSSRSEFSSSTEYGFEKDHVYTLVLVSISLFNSVGAKFSGSARLFIPICSFILDCSTSKNDLSTPLIDVLLQRGHLSKSQGSLSLYFIPDDRDCLALMEDRHPLICSTKIHESCIYGVARNTKANLNPNNPKLGCGNMTLQSPQPTGSQNP